MADLEKLAAEITAAADEVTKLKGAGADADADAIKAAVDKLLACKQSYADQNNGLLPDGKPFVAKMTKAQKKAAAKAAKEAADGGNAAAEVAEPAPGPAKPVCCFGTFNCALRTHSFLPSFTQSLNHSSALM